jgi:hypothetical protein
MISPIDPGDIPKMGALKGPHSAAENVADRFDEASVVHSRQCAQPQQRAGSRLEHVPDRVLQHLCHVGRHGLEEGEHRLQPTLRLAEQPSDGGRDDEEGEEGHQREIGKVARVDEPIRIDADGNPLHYLKGAGAGLHLRILLAEPGSSLSEPLAPGFGRFGRDALHDG